MEEENNNNSQSAPEASPSPAPERVQINLPKIKFSPNIFSDLIEKLVALIKKYASFEMLSKIIERMKMLATWVVTIMVVIIPIFGLIMAIKASSIELLFISIGVSVALVFCQYIAKGFISSMEKLLKNASAKLTTDTIPNAFGLSSIGLGLGVFVFSFRLFGVSFGSGVGGILVALALMLLGCVYMTPQMMNTEIDENNTPAQDLMGIYSFVFNGIVAIFPLIYLVLGAMTFAFLLNSIFSEDYLGTFFSSIGLAFVTALLPLIFYLTYIFYYLVVDVIKAVLEIPRIGKEK